MNFYLNGKGSYSDKHNTWELLSNIPDGIINKFELDKIKKGQTETPRRPGLRDRGEIKAKHLPEFLSND